MNGSDLNITCSSCKTVFGLAPELFERGGKTVTCAVCQHRFVVRVQPGPAEDSAMADESQDMTPVETIDTAGMTQEFSNVFSSSEMDEPAEETAAEEESAFSVEDDGASDWKTISDEPAPIEEDLEPQQPVFIDPNETVADSDILEAPEAPESELISAIKMTEELKTKKSEPEELSDAEEAKSKKKAKGWSSPEKIKKTLLTQEKHAEPSKGTIYFVLFLIMGAGGLATQLLPAGLWQLDPVWSIGVIALASLGFFLENLAGLFMLGSFTLFHLIGLFSNKYEAVRNGEITTIIPLALLFAISFLAILLYYVLRKRRRGHFVLKEGAAYSLLSLLLSFSALIIAAYAHMKPDTIPAFGRLEIFGNSLSSLLYYGAVPMTIVIISAIASLAITLGIQAHNVRNRFLALATVAVLLSFLIIVLLYAPLFYGPIQLDIGL
jgi:hypothetical protein